MCAVEGECRPTRVIEGARIQVGEGSGAVATRASSTVESTLFQEVAVEAALVDILMASLAGCRVAREEFRDLA